MIKVAKHKAGRPDAKLAWKLEDRIFGNSARYVYNKVLLQSTQTTRTQGLVPFEVIKRPANLHAVICTQPFWLIHHMPE